LALGLVELRRELRTPLGIGLRRHRAHLVGKHLELAHLVAADRIGELLACLLALLLQAQALLFALQAVRRASSSPAAPPRRPPAGRRAVPPPRGPPRPRGACPPISPPPGRLAIGMAKRCRSCGYSCGDASRRRSNIRPIRSIRLKSADSRRASRCRSISSRPIFSSAAFCAGVRI